MIAVAREATRLAEAGFHVLSVAGKIATTRHGVHDATADPEKARDWFKGRTDLGVAIACGHPLRTGGFLAVLDVDPKHDGDASLEELESEHLPLPETWTVRTPSGGWHFWLRTAEPHPTHVGFRPGLEIRGTGAYVVTAPSPGYRVERRARIADAPNWLLSLTRRSRTTPLPPAGPVELPPAGYIVAAIERECDELVSAPEGTRNSTLNRAAYSLARFVMAGHAKPEPIIRALAVAAAQAGLGEREIERTIKSAFRARQAA